MEEVIDTNIILRYLIGDNELQYKKSVDLFKKAEEGKRKLLIKPVIVAEACFVLESVYKKERNDIAEKFEVFLSQKWLKVEDRETMLYLWTWYRKNLHFVDSYLISWAKVNNGKLLSFDKILMKNFEKYD